MVGSYAPSCIKKFCSMKAKAKVFLKGVFAIYKPSGVTSHDVVNRIRALTGERRVGHAGTLDPFACGVLVVGVSRQYTKRLHDLQNSEKEYCAKLRLGATSSTDDVTGEIVELGQIRIPSRKQIEEVLRAFEGEIDQIPPTFSAVRRHGTRAYALARKGYYPSLGAHRVSIFSLHLLAYRWPFLEIELVCGSGVYVRALARDIGKALGVGAYLETLCRTRVGEYTLENSITLDEY